MAPRLAGDQPGVGVQVDAGAPAVGPAQVGAVGFRAAVDLDVPGGVDGPFQVDQGVGLDDHVGVPPPGVDVAPDDHRVAGLDVHVHLVHQDGQGPGEQEAEAPVPHQVAGLLDLQGIVDAVSFIVGQIGHVPLPALVADLPAPSRFDGLHGHLPRQGPAVGEEGHPQRLRHVSSGERGHQRRLEIELEELPARDGVEVVGAVKEGVAHAQVHVPAGGHGAGHPHGVGGGDDDIGVLPGHHRLHRSFRELRSGSDGAAGLHQGVLPGGDLDQRVRAPGKDVGPLEHGDRGAAVDVDVRPRPRGRDGSGDLY